MQRRRYQQKMLHTTRQINIEHSAWRPNICLALPLFFDLSLSFADELVPISLSSSDWTSFMGLASFSFKEFERRKRIGRLSSPGLPFNCTSFPAGESSPSTILVGLVSRTNLCRFNNVDDASFAFFGTPVLALSQKTLPSPPWTIRNVVEISDKKTMGAGIPTNQNVALVPLENPQSTTQEGV